MKRRRSQHRHGALELIEEATQLLRTAPVSLLAGYYLGALPFVLGLLFFFADMGSNPFAPQHVLEAALGMSVLFLWMKILQALFARRARGLLTGIAPPPVTFREVVRIAASQLAFQPVGLILIPVAAVLTVPFAWVSSFFQNLTVLDDGRPADFNQLFRRALKQSALWPGENQAIKLLMFGFSLFVFLNWMILGLAAPQLLKTLLGIETVFSRSPWAMVNSTFFAAAFGLTYLSVDPILKLIHVLRCFYGEALTDGADLKAALSRQAGAGWKTAGLFVLVVMLVGTGPAVAAEADGPAPAASATTAAVNSPELDRAIREVVGQRKYVWRLPRAEREPSAGAPARAPGLVARFFEKAFKLLGQAVTAVLRVIDRVLRRIFSGWNPRSISPDTGFSWIAFQRLLLYVLGFAVLWAAVYLAWRVWRSRSGRGGGVVEAPPLRPVADLTDEDLRADQLPGDGWTRLAEKLLERGELRLALRAFYLGSLAHLAERHLITLARSKSNRDYQQELQRRGHALAELLPPFTENVSVFERIWYGTHVVSRESVARFIANVERIKARA